jgi:hypothetical protein
MSEEVFEKADIPPKVEKKAKKPVSQATLDALARGREKMRLKREAAKAEKEAKKEKKEQVKMEIKEEKAGEKKDVEQKRKYRKSAKQLKKEQDALERVRAKERAALKQAKIQRYHDAKCRILEKCNSVAVYNQINSALDNIDEDEIADDDRLYEKLTNLKTSLQNQDQFELREQMKKHQGSIRTEPDAVRVEE